MDFCSDIVGYNWVPKSNFSCFVEKRIGQNQKFFFGILRASVRTIIVQTTYTSELTDFRIRLPTTFLAPLKSNLMRLIYWIHQPGGVQVALFFTNFFS